jgi:hypothetical protein
MCLEFLVAASLRHKSFILWHQTLKDLLIFFYDLLNFVKFFMFVIWVFHLNLIGYFPQINFFYNLTHCEI